jgi:methyl-accepting chemotaxis protein
MTDSEQLVEIKSLLNHLTENVGSLTKDVDSLKQEMVRTNDRVETYQKSSQQLVNIGLGYRFGQ